jgi:hypothetical protein
VEEAAVAGIILGWLGKGSCEEQDNFIEGTNYRIVELETDLGRATVDWPLVETDGGDEQGTGHQGLS